ncbi:cupin domain-containing protein [Ructibacterium gallinarum]|uniref:AraC family ligand binding domain-containing protein n=1 Tax=Ructibacterium gallinarum TaxID=2779355 RepID=A0A9D5RA06_9FIRM|nr:AraC family ligand binding domain-containing protein [Ructibacterium gallinarum]MBE5041019.1 AraC family ligand binding domain-containing protein [Ructibacterium gallinarum]
MKEILCYKEEQIKSSDPFPVQIFIRDSELEDISTSSHFHDCFEILYMLSGCACQIINGKEFFLKENDTIIIKNGDIHSITAK